MRMLRPVLVICASLICQNQSLAQDDSFDSVIKIRSHVRANTSNLPNYMCTETIARETFRIDLPPHGDETESCRSLVDAFSKAHPRLGPIATDRLRLDVGLNGNSEMYSWVGEGHFQDQNLSEIVKQGAVSTGAFGTFLSAIFIHNQASFTFRGKSEEGARSVLTYDFVVPIQNSGYQVSNNLLTRLTGYSGMFKVDAQSLDLIQLEIRTDPLPPELQICRSTTTLDYGRVQLSGLSVLLPSAVNVRIVASDGSESHNRTTFSGCHQFLGESKLILDDQSPDALTAVPPVSKAKTIHLSRGLKVDIALTQMIDPNVAAEGDLIKGRLAKAVKDKETGLTIPKGTIVDGRIFELTLINSVGTQLEFGVRWDSFEYGGLSHPLHLAVSAAMSGTSALQPIHGEFRDIETRMEPERPGVGLFYFPYVGHYYKIPSGFEAEWVTSRAESN